MYVYERFSMAHLKMISEQLDENVIGKLTYLPERLGMYISKNEKIYLVNVCSILLGYNDGCSNNDD